MCTQLHERDTVCTKDQLQRIAEIGSAIGISSDYWKDLGNGTNERRDREENEMNYDSAIRMLESQEFFRALIGW